MITYVDSAFDDPAEIASLSFDDCGTKKDVGSACNDGHGVADEARRSSRPRELPNLQRLKPTSSIQNCNVI